MEHFKSPFRASDFESKRAVQNQKFFDDVFERARRHPFFSHPFMSTSTWCRHARSSLSS